MRYLFIHIFVLIALVAFPHFTAAQSFTSSNLPIIIINTDNGATIPDDPKIGAEMKIIWHEDGARNFMTDIDSAQFLNYNGRIGIETRGSTSQNLQKKPFGFTTLQDDNITKNNVSLLGLPAENDWTLNSLAYDQTAMRDFIAYELSRKLGQYSPRCVYCEVVINGTYNGLYMLVEKIKVDKKRVNIEKITTNDISAPNITGGYITKADKNTGGDPIAWSMVPYHGENVNFIHHFPKPDSITMTQNNYIKNVFMNVASTCHANNTSIENGFPSLIDIPTFIDFMMVGELSSNVDVYQLSTFFHKDRNGKLRAGPIWDYNLSFGYDEYGWRSRYDVWQFSNYDNEGAKFWADLFDNPTFRCYFSRRWHQLTQTEQPSDYQVIINRINELDEILEESIERDNNKWNRMYYHDYYINDMKEWLAYRISWIDANIGSCDECSNVVTPPLVISRIHYHPLGEWGFSEEQLEFIEITNNGPDVVDLSGIYFGELGITYCFPYGSSIEGGQAIWLCSDSTAFSEFYGTTPFGQYTRHLSNKSQNLVLSDAWGNVIDQVQYLDSLPWPKEADGEGYYLQLIDLDYDNSLAESWTTGRDCDISGTNNVSITDKIDIFPNPASDFIKVRSYGNCDITITNMLGQVAYHGYHNESNASINVSGLANGIYIIGITANDKRATGRLVISR